MPDCIFCKIIKGEIPNYTVYQDADVLAFLDIFPCSRGHVVVVPKRHAVSLFELSDSETDNLSRGLMIAARKVKNVLNPDGFNIGLNEGPAAGQAVPHVHYHIIPRYQNDGGGNIHSIIKTKEKIDVGELAKLFK